MLKGYADHWGLVTGASSGIGAEFSRQLAARGMHLVLVARREDRLRGLAEELEAAHGTRCEIIPADLSQPHAGQDLLAEVSRRGIMVELLVNNAGFGLVSSVEETDVGRALELIQVNVTGLTELTLLMAQEMVLLTAVENGGAGTVSRRSKMAAHNRAGLWAGTIGATAPITPPFRERHRSALRHGDLERDTPRGANGRLE